MNAYWLTLSKLGLILNTIGAIVLIVGSNKVIDVMTKFVDIVTPTYGTYGQGAVVPKIKELGKEFTKAKTQSQIINTIGYLLFALGFILQLI
ncbi:MAG: hypothetical protein JWP78_2055 [Mucilaginibacter sp.]|nr:hypothetical protein [Mucilaginibacter sp.]